MVHHPRFSRAYIYGQGSLERLVGDVRRNQNQRAEGKTLIVGAGTGLDVPPLGQTVTDVLLLEPDATMRKYLAQKYPALAVTASAAERISTDEQPFDTVISSLVLCSVESVKEVLAEIHRVLRPGGQYLFMEHVLHDRFLSRTTQYLVNPIWKRIGGGCNLNRDIHSELKASPLELKEYSVKRGNFIAPIVSGRAIRPG